MTKYDTVYYWIGGREEGEWRVIHRPSSLFIEETVAHLKRSGYVAVRGIENIGPPEGPPADSAFKALGL